MTRLKTTSWLLAGVTTLFTLAPTTNLNAQDAEAGPLAVTIDGVSVDGENYRSVTITSDSPLSFEFSDPAAPQDCIRGSQTQSNTHIGRNGPLTSREMDMARTAWSYFETSFQPETGLVNAVGSFPSTTLWDTASYISAMVAAYELCLIDKREFDSRANQLINTLRNLPL